MYIFLDGEYVKQEEAKISPFDHGFLYGLGLFETFRIYDGHPFLLDDHFQRLHKGLDHLNIHFSFSNEEIVTIISELLVRNNLRDAYVRLNVSAGVSPIGFNVEAYRSPSLIIFIKEISRMASQRDAVFLDVRRNTPETNYRLKSHHYLNNVIAKREVGQLDLEGIFLTEEGYVAEGIVSNIFWLKKGVIYTPCVETGILDGVTRRFVISLANYLGIECQEGFFSPDHLLSADEVFITNSIQEIVEIKRINERVYSSAVDSVTKIFQKYYRHYVQQKLTSRLELKGV